MDKRILTFKDLTKKESVEKFFLSDDEKSKFVDSINIGDKVSHIRFGHGEVYHIESDIISINFSGEIKKFPFPDVFVEGYVEIL